MAHATRRLAAVVGTLLLIGVACTGSPSTEPTPAPGAEFARGGTLRVVVVYLEAQLDPQKAYNSPEWEVFRCCLLRTLLSYNGRPTAEGGNVLRPDLADGMPMVSDDGLTWTFHIEPGIRYAPPLEDVEVVAEDFIRALKREARPEVAPPGGFTSWSGYPFYFSAIQGFDAYRAGEASTISGLESPDDHTLLVHLTEPAGDLGYRFSLAATAPIPANPSDPGAALGVAEGHDEDYGRFLVATGPYMVEGAEALDFSVPPRKQVPASGYTPVEGDEEANVVTQPEELTLVRNPSWAASTDELRAAYPDRIELLGPPQFTREGYERAVRMVDAGKRDMFFELHPPPDQIQRYASSPGLAGRVSTASADRILYLGMNLAVPPFDDLHVRRAVSYAIDRERLVGLWNDAGLGGLMATHIAPDSTEGDLLAGMAAPVGQSGDPARAAGEMRLATRYDTDGDGRCDVAACARVPALVKRGVWPLGPPYAEDPWRDMAAAIETDLRRIGIELDVQRVDGVEMFDLTGRPEEHVPIALNLWWAKDYPNASTFFATQFHGDCIGQGSPCFSPSLVGASARQLRTWGYDVTRVPNVDDRIDRCMPLVGQEQLDCWAELDRYVTEDVVPWVPYLSLTNTRVVSGRVASFTWDQFTNLPSLDRIALTPEAIAGAPVSSMP